MRSRERFIFAGERGGGDLRDHEAGIEARFGREKRGKHAGERIGHLLDAAFGDSAKRGDRNGHLIGGHGEGLAVKISAADDVAFAVFLDEDERIVRSAVQLHLRDGASLHKGIAYGAVDLRRATQAVCVLDARVSVR